jgi:hypothetical protein
MTKKEQAQEQEQAQKQEQDIYTKLSPEELEEEEEERIAAVTEAAVHYNQGVGYNHFGKRKSKQRRQRYKKQYLKRRTSKLRFGTTSNHHLKSFLWIVLLMLIRSTIKGKPYSNTIHSDIDLITNNAFNVLTITTILELIGKIVGNENRDKILLAYTILSIGGDIANIF